MMTPLSSTTPMIHGDVRLPDGRVARREPRKAVLCVDSTGVQYQADLTDQQIDLLKLMPAPVVQRDTYAEIDD